MRTHKRPLVVLPCGAGKTVVFAWLARQTQNKNNTVWFLVHRRELLDQTVSTFQKFDISMDNIHVGMVATVANHPERWPDPDLIIFDEGHHASAATWRRIIDRYPEAWMIGLTATPCRMDGKPLNEVYDDMVIGITTAEMIDQGYLAPYRYFAPAVADLTGLNKKGRDYDQEQASDILMQRAVYGDVINHWREHADGYQTICYCSSIRHSKAVAEAFQDAGITAVHFDGDTKAKERRDIIDRFRAGEIKILCNVDLISEGFDVPDCWCCILLRPTASTSLFIQQSGRALRPQPEKTAIILDHVGNYARHGLPNTDRDWSLTERVKQPAQYRDDGQLTVRQCEFCYFTFPSGPDICPNCGEMVKKTRQEIKNIEKVRLEEITEIRRNKADERVRDKSIDECRTLMELQAYARANGKKSGWAWYVWQGRRKRA